MHPRRRSPLAASRRRRWAWGILVAAGLVPAGTARAQESRSFEVTVKPGGQPWTVGEHGTGVECSPLCTLRLTPQRYRVTMGDTAEDVWIDGSSEIAYRPPVRALRYAGGAMMGVGLVTGGVLTYAAVKLCTSETMTWPDGTTTYVNKSCGKPVLSRTGQYALISVAAGSFAMAVVGGILFYLGGESIRVRDVAPPGGGAQTSSHLTFDVSGQGASIGWTARF